MFNIIIDFLEHKLIYFNAIINSTFEIMTKTKLKELRKKF
jgi:hypothetical protein